MRVIRAADDDDGRKQMPAAKLAIVEARRRDVEPVRPLAVTFAQFVVGMVFLLRRSAVARGGLPCR